MSIEKYNIFIVNYYRMYDKVKQMTDTKKKIYLDHAATTPVRSEILDVMMEHFINNFGNPSSIYSRGVEAKRNLENYRKDIASSINALPEEIFFVSGGTEADNWAIKGSAKANIKKGRHLITSAIEHHAVLNSFKSLEKEGWEVTYLGVDNYGLVDPDDVRKAIRDDTVLVSVMMANNEIGTIQPVAEIASVCKTAKVIFHTDAVQALGALHIDVKESGADMMSFSGHKIYAPKGIGFLYVRKGVKIASILDGGGQEKKKRPGTENLPYIAALAKAVVIAQNECCEMSDRLTSMRNDLFNKVLSRIPHSRINGSREKRLPGNANFSFEFIEGESLLLLLDSMGYECSSGSACTSGSLDPSHVLLAIGLPHEIAHGSLRVTFGKDSDPDDIDGLVDVLEVIVKRLRDMSPLYEDFLNGKLSEPHCMLTGDSSYCKSNEGCIRV